MKHAWDFLRVWPRPLILMVGSTALLVSSAAWLAAGGHAAFPAWLEGLSTFAAFVAAGLAAIYAAGAFGLESAREGRWLAAQERAQADLFAHWSAVAVGAHGRVGDQVRDYIPKYTIWLRNASQLPVFDVRATFKLWLELDNGSVPRMIEDTVVFKQIRPQDTREHTSELPSIQHSRPVRDERWLPDSRIEVDITFRDTAGLEWRRTDDGKLHGPLDPPR